MALSEHVKPFVYAGVAAVVIGLVSAVSGIIGVVKDANQYERDLTIRNKMEVYAKEQSAKMDWPSFPAPEKRYPSIQGRIDMECPRISQDAVRLTAKLQAKVELQDAVSALVKEQIAANRTYAFAKIYIDPDHLAYVLRTVGANYQADHFKRDSFQIENYAYQLCDTNHYKEHGFTE